MKKEPTPFSFDPIAEKFFSTSLSYQLSVIFLTACELDIFTAIGDDFKTAEEIANDIEASPRALRRLLNALVANGFLRRSGLKYLNTKETLEYLVKGSPNYIGSFKPFKTFIRHWLELPEIIRNNQRRKTFAFYDLDSSDIESMLGLMNWRTNRQAPEFIKYIDLSKVIRVLDLGCGPGTLGMEILKYNINIDLTLFDYPRIIPLTEKFIERKGFNGFVKTMAGDFLVDEIGNNYDLVIVSNVLRLYSFRDSLRILNKVFDALRTKGKVVVQESLFDSDRVSPLFATMQSLDLLLFTAEGDLYTETEIILLLKEAWFSNIHKHETSYGSTIFIGEK